MELDRVRQLQRERKWMQFCSLIIDCMGSSPMDKLLDIFLESAGQAHPRSSCEVFLAFAERLSPEEGIKVLAIGEKIIREAVLYSESFEVEKMLLDMRKCLLLVERGDLKGIEKKLFEWKGVKMARNVDMMYNLLGFKLYEKIQNIEVAFPYLLRYVRASESEDLVDTLVEYAMLSKEFFNFTLITSLPSFEKMKSSSLREIFVMFREGDIRELKNRHDKFTEIFRDRSEIVEEKIYMIALINICFSETEKRISIKKVEELLEISNKTAVYIILKSFGLGLIEGWMDGEKGILYFDCLVPRVLQTEEITKLKEKFNSWEQRVHEVISMLK